MKADRDTFARLLPQAREDVSALLDVLWTYPPYCFLTNPGNRRYWTSISVSALWML